MGNNLVFIVYCTTCTENGKIYIGVHKTENPDVFDGYIGNGLQIGWTLKNPKTAFQRAVKKYGYSKFKRSTLYVFTSEEEAYQKEAEIVNLEFVKRRDNYNTSIGGKHPGTKYKSLYQYSKDGDFIKEWNSVESAVSYFNCNSNRFNMVVQDKRSAFGYYWSYEYCEKLDISQYAKSFHDCETYQYNLKGELLHKYSSIKEITNDYPELNRKTIAYARSNKVPIQGYYFLDPNVNVIDLIKTREMIFCLTDKSISKYKNGILVQTYPSISNAAKQNKISANTIKKSINNNEGIWSYGYSLQYEENKNPVPLKIDQYDTEGVFVRTWDSLSQCLKEYPKAKSVIKGERHHTKGYIFKLHDLN